MNFIKKEASSEELERIKMIEDEVKPLYEKKSSFDIDLEDLKMQFRKHALEQMKIRLLKA